MAKPEITLYNPQSKDMQTIRLGYSFTMLLFGFFVPFFRRDWKTGFILMLCDILSLSAVSVIFAWFYNFYDVRRLIKKAMSYKKSTGSCRPKKWKNSKKRPE